MSVISTPLLKESTDSLLRFALRLDAVVSGLVGIAGIPFAGTLAEMSGTTAAFEYSVSAFFIAYGVVVLALAQLPALRTPGILVITGNLLYTVGAVVFVVSGWMPLTTIGVVGTLATGVCTLVFAELQYMGLRRLSR